MKLGNIMTNRNITVSEALDQLKEGKIGRFEYVVNEGEENPIDRYSADVSVRDNGDIVERICGHGQGCFWTDGEVIDWID